MNHKLNRCRENADKEKFWTSADVYLTFGNQTEAGESIVSRTRWAKEAHGPTQF